MGNAAHAHELLEVYDDHEDGQTEGVVHDGCDPGNDACLARQTQKAAGWQRLSRDAGEHRQENGSMRQHDGQSEQAERHKNGKEEAAEPHERREEGS